jgi:hypothetical protein
VVELNILMPTNNDTFLGRVKESEELLEERAEAAVI